MGLVLLVERLCIVPKWCFEISQSRLFVTRMEFLLWKAVEKSGIPGALLASWLVIMHSAYLHAVYIAFCEVAVIGMAQFLTKFPVVL